jgi:hypothetical protein
MRNNIKGYAGAEIFTAVVMKHFIVCDISPSRPLKVNSLFERRAKLRYLLYACFLLCLFFDREDMFFRDVGRF